MNLKDVLLETLTDTITDVYFRERDNRAFIAISDGSIMQWGSTPEEIEQVKAEIPNLLGATLTKLINDTTKGYFRMEYYAKTEPRRVRFLEFNYSVEEQAKYEASN